jgi:hypothetical protein
MRTLSPTLQAAQRSACAVPYLRVVVRDRIAGVRRPVFERLYTGGEADSYHAAAMPTDGSLLRARVSGGRLYYQRVAAPGPSSDFSSWTELEPAANADVALCTEGSRVLIFWVDSDGVTLKVRESADGGATFGAPVAVATSAAAAGWLAADVKADGDALLLYSAGATVFAVRRSGGSWDAPTAWPNSAASLSGLACYHQGDWNVAVAGADGAGNGLLWTCLFGEGFSQAAGTWSPLREVTRASAGSGMSFRAPFLSQPDVFRLTFVETYSGSASYSRPQHSHSPATADFAANLWREPSPFDLSSEYGQALAFGDDTLWLCTPFGVWRASTDAPDLDVSADVLEAVTVDEPFAGGLRLVLRNDDGRYAQDAPPLRIGAEVRVSPGYVTVSGPEASDGPAYWIERLERVSGAGRAALVVEAQDGWSLLDAWRARRQYSWAAGEKNVFGILAFLSARAGLDFSSLGTSPQATGLYPAFTVHPGESGLTAVGRLQAMVPDVLLFRGETALLLEPLPTDVPLYAYGTDHVILAGRYGERVPAANRVQVFGRGVFAEAFDWPDVARVYDRLLQIYDANLRTATQVADRAVTVLREEAIGSTSGEIVVPVNCGQELYDVVEVTDAAGALQAAKRRVLGLMLRYSAGERPLYEQRLRLSGV